MQVGEPSQKISNSFFFGFRLFRRDRPTIFQVVGLLFYTHRGVAFVAVGACSIACFTASPYHQKFSCSSHRTEEAKKNCTMALRTQGQSFLITQFIARSFIPVSHKLLYIHQWTPSPQRRQKHTSFKTVSLFQGRRNLCSASHMFNARFDGNSH